MPRAKFTVTLPDETWMGHVSSSHTDTVFRVVTVVSGTESSVALLELTGRNPVPIIAAIEGSEDVASLELLWSDPDEALLQVETANPVLLESLGEVGVPLRTPFEVVDGRASWTVTTSRDRLSALSDQLDAGGIRFDIDYVRTIEDSDSESVLTDRQRELVFEAVERGYYETPRRATLTDIAESMDISKATASDILHRAEGRIVDWFVASRNSWETTQ